MVQPIEMLFAAHDPLIGKFSPSVDDLLFR
jgi:hypothetical protein